jgi:hypothetical protein
LDGQSSAERRASPANIHLKTGRMDKDLAIELFLYGIILTAFSFLGHQLQLGIPSAVLWSAAAGGILVSVLAVFVGRGFRVHVWCLATLSLLAVLLIVHAAKSWLGFSRIPSARITAPVISMLSIFALGEIATLLKNMRATRLPGDNTPSDAKIKPNGTAGAPVRDPSR